MDNAKYLTATEMRKNTKSNLDSIFDMIHAAANHGKFCVPLHCQIQEADIKALKKYGYKIETEVFPFPGFDQTVTVIHW